MPTKRGQKEGQLVSDMLQFNTNELLTCIKVKDAYSIKSRRDRTMSCLSCLPAIQYPRRLPPPVLLLNAPRNTYNRGTDRREHETVVIWFFKGLQVTARVERTFVCLCGGLLYAQTHARLNLLERPCIIGQEKRLFSLQIWALTARIVCHLLQHLLLLLFLLSFPGS